MITGADVIVVGFDGGVKKDEVIYKFRYRGNLWYL